MDHDFHKPYRDETRSSRELVEIYRIDPEGDEGVSAIATIHFRGGQEEFALGKLLVESLCSQDRIIGADVLSQLGWAKQNFKQESVSLLLPLLRDEYCPVVAAAAHALGHRNDARAISALLPLVSHVDAEVRRAVVSGLSGHNDVRAVKALISLSCDADLDIRDWAAFGLGSLTEYDCEELRNALINLTNDSDAEVRGEALIGLARRDDPRGVELLKRELSGVFQGDWPLEAAEIYQSPELIPFIRRHMETWDSNEDSGFKGSFEGAIEACSGQDALQTSCETENSRLSGSSGNA